MAAVLPSAACAQSFLEIVNGTAARTTTGSNQVVGSGVGYVVGQLRLRLAAEQRAFISYSFEGAESQLRDQFFGSGESSMIDSLALDGTTLTTRITSGLLDFRFLSPAGTGASNRNNYVWNDANIGIVLDSDRLSGRLMFEDGHGRLGSDWDYDDMVVRFNVSVMAVPEASSIAMMLAGFGLVGLAARRRKSVQRSGRVTA